LPAGTSCDPGGEHGHWEPQARPRHARPARHAARPVMAVRQPLRSLTIAHLLPWPGIGGTEHATLRIARAAAERGYRNVAFYRQDSPVVGEFFRDAGLETAPYELAELSARRPLPFVRNTLALRRAFRAHQVDLIHCADIDAALQVAPAGRLAGVPVLCHIRNPWTSMLRREALVLS